MGFLNKQGSATVFMGIILPVVISACVLLSDVYIYDSGKHIIENSVDASACSVLGKYSGFLKENYDLYAYCINDETIKSIVIENLSNNLANDGIYDFRIEDIQISKGNDLIKIQTMLKMIEISAADDVYKNLIDEFLDRFDVISGFSGAAEIIALKMKLDKSYQKIKDSMVALNKIINGGEDIEYYVNLSGINSEFGNAVEKFNEYRYKINELTHRILEFTDEIENEPSEKAAILVLMDEQLGQLREEAADIYCSFIEGFIEGLKQVNNEAIKHISDIVMENENIHFISNAIRNNISKISDCPQYIKEIAYKCTEIVKDAEEAFVELLFEEIRIEIEHNISMLYKLEDAFISSIEEGKADNSITDDALNEYNSGIEFVYTEEAKAGKEKDQRSFFEEMGKRILEKQVGKDIKISETGILPSYLASKDTAAFEATSMGCDTASGEAEINGVAESLNRADMGLSVTLALDEYILDHFGYQNTSEREKLPAGFFTNEVEYILWGDESQNVNNFYTKAALMSVRFALNAIHVYSDANKTAKADTVATMTAGWWTLGAGIPVMSNLIKISWAIAESGIDTGKLWNGESLAIIKSPAEWITDIGLGAAGVSTPGFLTMDYDDYLRLYLLLMPIEKKVLRMMDIIELNAPSNFNIYDAYTQITVTALVSYRSLTGGRHEVEISASQSY